MKEYPNFNITGEAWYEDPSIISYWQRGKTNQNGYSSDLPSLCDFPLQNALIRSLNSKGGYEDEWMPLYEMLAKDFNYPDPGNLVVFADNHDMSRLLTQVGGDMAKFKMALAYILTIRGIPQIYYGTETLMTNEGTDNHGVIRSDFPGGWVGDPINAFSGESTTSPQREAKEFLRNILQWRKTSGAIHSGKTIHFVPKNEIYVYFRISEAQTVMTILNKNTLPVSLDLNRFHSVLPKDCNAMDVITGKEVHLSGTLNLSEAGPMILQVKH
jgi:glycosidase